ncbi:histidine triad nucleotide binding protein [Mycobacterium phage Iota]|nr:histidine triad nucleotide binding protein [Mycobacterium phage Iota]
MTDCVFCPDNWDNLDIVAGPIRGPARVSVDDWDDSFQVPEDYGRVIIINPLRPVTEGHVLLIHETHGPNLASNYAVARDLFGVAAWYLRDKDQPEGSFQANVITSMGPAATQTVMHTHVHIVPRREGDGLPLPWTLQQLREKREAEIEQVLNGPLREAMAAQDAGPHTVTAKDGRTAPCGGPGACYVCDKEA